LLLTRSDSLFSRLLGCQYLVHGRLGTGRGLLLWIVCHDPALLFKYARCLQAGKALLKGSYYANFLTRF
jgi:hypothetical protein